MTVRCPYPPRSIFSLGCHGNHDATCFLKKTCLCFAGVTESQFYFLTFSCLRQKGKVRPLKQLEKNEEVQSAFIQLAHEPTISSSTIATLEKFTCEMYGKHKLISVNEVRFQMFLDKYKPKKGIQYLSIQKLDGSALPPCSRTLLQKIRRTHLIAQRWISSTTLIQSTLCPLQYGWKEVEGVYRPVWFEGSTSLAYVDLTTNKDYVQGKSCSLY